MLDKIIASKVPEGTRDKEGEPVTGFRIWDIYRTEAKRRASSSAACASLITTPRRWAALYPDRAPFTFERFGIDRHQLKVECKWSKPRRIKYPQGRP